MTALKCFIIIGQNSDLFQEKIENKIIPQSKESQRMNLPTAIRQPIQLSLLFQVLNLPPMK